MRAISRFRRLAGMSTVWWAAVIALRMRVRKSAMGSVTVYLPGALRHPRDEALVRELAEADPADAELAVHGARTATATAPGVSAGLELGRARLAHTLGRLGHQAASAESEMVVANFGRP